MEDSSTKQASENLSNTNTNPDQISQSTETKRTPLNETIQIFLRLRPCRNGSYKHDHIEINSSLTSVDIKVPIKEEGYVNNSIRKHTFKFDKIFDCPTTQDQIFDEVAKDVIDSAIDGYNGTIFAYGQTGSGKTYTITGGVESISMRGIIPRALSYIFEETKKRTLFTWKVYISYLEIYNNDGYDLLSDTGAGGTQRRFELESLPRVRIRENRSRQLILTNLSIHEIDNFQEGMALLMLGDDNRVVAETPKNDASTRSHCLFMIQIESQKIGEDLKTLSKLHIVDLSGSETPSKTNLSGIRMTEALNINVSLFYLEQVIIEINNKSSYIPYRNSMMTMCLRDSLGGNCKTRMIANLSADFEDVLESLSTCRFAQRVALVKNTAVVNEIVDPAILVQKQKNEIEELKAELAMLKGKNQKSFLEQSDLDECEKIVKEFLEDDTYTKKIELNDKLMIQECFNIIKKKYKSLEECKSNIEVQVLEKLNHENIIQLKEVIRDWNGEVSYIFEYCDCNVLEFIDIHKTNKKIIPEPIIREIIKQLTKGLKYLHSKQFLHRDLKPENILLILNKYDLNNLSKNDINNSGIKVKIADFGTAKKIPSKNENTITEYICTRWYRSPECVLRADYYNETSDIWAIGCIMAELYKLGPIFPGENEFDQINQILKILGTPTKRKWPWGYSQAESLGISFSIYYKKNLKIILGYINNDGLNLLNEILYKS